MPSEYNNALRADKSHIFVMNVQHTRCQHHTLDDYNNCTRLQLDP